MYKVFRLVVTFFLLSNGFAAYSSEITNVLDSTKYLSETPKSLLSKARKAADNDEYAEAKEIYLYLLQKDSTNATYNYECGLNFFLNLFEQPLSLPYFERALKYSGKDTIVKVFYYLGQAYQLNNRYDEAAAAYLNYTRFIKKNKTELQDVYQKIAQCTQGKSFLATFNNVVNIANLGNRINTSEAEYVPVVKGDESVMYFTARRKSNVGGEKDIETNRYFEDMFISKGDSGIFSAGSRFTIGDSLTKRLRNTGANEAVVSLSFDEKYLISYKNNSLWYSEWINNGWSKPTRFSKNINLGEYQNHGSFSAHNDTLYFSSNAAGGFGGMDIYYSVKSASGKWGKAQNIGASVNTPEDEDSPTISFDNVTLYYSSKGHNSMGGYDVYKSVFSDGKWMESLNLGMPINSAGDDIYFKYDKFKRQAYFSSSRQNGFGDYDIYRLIDYNTPRFENCEYIKSLKGFPIELDAKKQLEPKLANSVYHWEFEDGTNAEGSKVTHEFAETGKHLVKLFEMDSLSGNVLQKKDTLLTVSNINLEQFNTGDTVSVDSLLLFDGAPALIKNSTVLKYHWSFGDSTFGGDSASAKHLYKRPGTYEVKLSMVARNDSTEEVFQKCITKTVNILNKEEYMKYYMNSVERENNKKVFSSSFLTLAKLDFLAPDTTTLELLNLFDASPVFVPKATILRYDWSFGALLPTISAKKVNHKYDSTGVYEVKMNVIYQVDSTKGIYEADVKKNVVVINKEAYDSLVQKRMERNNAAKSFDSETLSKPKLELLSPDTTTLDLLTIFDSKLINVANSKVVKYTWSYGDSSIQKEFRKTSHAYKRIGDYDVKLKVVYQNNTTKALYEDEITKKIAVIDTAAYAKIIAARSKSKKQEKITFQDYKISAQFDTTGVPSIALENIYFDYDKFAIRPDAKEALLRNIQVLSVDTLLAIKVSANTDSRGSKAYNFKLSAKRAISAINFLAENNIARNRIIAIVSKGETNLVNKCGDNIKCTEAEHQLNRRDEFKVVGRLKK